MDGEENYETESDTAESQARLRASDTGTNQEDSAAVVGGTNQGENDGEEENENSTPAQNHDAPPGHLQSPRRPPAARRSKTGLELMCSKSLALMKGQIKGMKQCAKDYVNDLTKSLLKRLLSTDHLKFAMTDDAISLALKRMIGRHDFQQPAFQTPYETFKREIKQTHLECHGATINMQRTGLIRIEAFLAEALQHLVKCITALRPDQLVTAKWLETEGIKHIEDPLWRNLLMSIVGRSSLHPPLKLPVPCKHTCL